MIFHVLPPSLTGILWLVFLVIFLIIATLHVWDKATGIQALIGRTVTVAITFLFCVILLSSFLTFVHIDEDRLRIWGFGLSVPIEDIAINRSRVVNMDEHPSYALRRKTGGFSVGGYQRGWFDNNKLVYLTNREKVAYIPTECCTLMISLDDPQSLIDEIERIQNAKEIST